jgi:hypothetical protein
MKTYNDIRELNENEVQLLLNNNEISILVYQEWFLKTSIYQRLLKNTEVLKQINRRIYEA